MNGAQCIGHYRWSAAEVADRFPPQFDLHRRFVLQHCCHEREYRDALRDRRLAPRTRIEVNCGDHVVPYTGLWCAIEGFWKPMFGPISFQFTAAAIPDGTTFLIFERPRYPGGTYVDLLQAGDRVCGSQTKLLRMADFVLPTENKFFNTVSSKQTIRLIATSPFPMAVGSTQIGLANMHDTDRDSRCERHPCPEKVPGDFKAYARALYDPEHAALYTDDSFWHEPGVARG